MRSLACLSPALLTLALAAAMSGCFSNYKGDCNRDPEENCFWGTGGGGTGGSMTTSTMPVCGDGKEEGDEACDDGNHDDCDGCRGDCSAKEKGCGDGFLCGIEECDDGNTQPGDNCSSDCRVECRVGNLPFGDNPENYALFYDNATGHCYVHIKKPQKAWLAAHQACLDWQGDLFAFSDASEASTVIAGLGGLSARSWTGGSDPAMDGDFRWSNSESWPASPPWAPGEPDFAGPGCVAIDSTGLLRDYGCAEITVGAFICEMAPP